MALKDYLATEVGEDWADGIVSRREALRRLALLGLSLTSAIALLEACAPVGGPAASSVSSGHRAASAAASASAGTGQGSGGSASAAAGSSGSAAAAGDAITFAGPNGEVRGFFAAAGQRRGGMLVIHENRGLNDHIRSVAQRLAGDGYSSLAVDLLSEEGGSESLPQGEVQAALARAPMERLVGDMKAGLDELERRIPGAKVGVIGFCYGGGMVWALLDAGDPRLAAAIPFYGPAPSGPDFSGNKAAVFAVYAELDDRVNASRPTAEAALVAAGLEHQIKVYPGVDHAFFNDTGARYNAQQAAAAYSDVLAWLGRYLG
ncbi:MAG: dienelactone hydrolase family protein [Chloroflexota bacterium]